MAKQAADCRVTHTGPQGCPFEGDFQNRRRASSARSWEPPGQEGASSSSAAPAPGPAESCRENRRAGPEAGGRAALRWDPSARPARSPGTRATVRPRKGTAPRAEVPGRPRPGSPSLRTTRPPAASLTAAAPSLPAGAPRPCRRRPRAAPPRTRWRSWSTTSTRSTSTRTQPRCASSRPRPAFPRRRPRNGLSSAWLSGGGRKAYPQSADP